MSYTAAAAATEFGIESLSEKLQKEVRDPKKNDLHVFIVMVEKTKPWDEDQDFPYYMCVIEEDSKVVVSKMGYYEAPYHVTRYLKWGNKPLRFRSYMDSIARGTQTLITSEADGCPS